MLTSFKQRTLDKGHPVQIYKNLHKNCYSVRQFGKVIGHTDEILLDFCSFHVSKKGVQRIRRERKKSVVAYIDGFIIPCNSKIRPKILDVISSKGVDITFNPYKDETFKCIKTSTPIKKAKYCYLAPQIKKVFQ